MVPPLLAELGTLPRAHKNAARRHSLPLWLSERDCTLRERGMMGWSPEGSRGIEPARTSPRAARIGLTRLSGASELWRRARLDPPLGLPVVFAVPTNERRRAVHPCAGLISCPKAAVAPSNRSAPFARQTQLPVHQATPAPTGGHSMPRSRDRSSRDRDRRRSRDDSDDEDIDEVWRAGTTKPRSRRHDRTARSAEYDEFLRTRPAPAPTLSPRDKTTRSSWDLAAFAS